MARGKVSIKVPPRLRSRFGNLNHLRKSEVPRILAEIDALMEVHRQKLKEAKEADPFWFYEPSSGDITPERLGFLESYLKPEDIPQKLDGQIDAHQSEAPIRGVSGGNQSGKTTSCCIEAFIKTTGELPESLKGKFPVSRLPKRFPQHVRVVCEDHTKGILGNAIPTYRRWVPREWLVDGSWDKSFSAEQLTLRLTAPKDDEQGRYRKGQVTGTIEFMSNKQDVGVFQGPPKHMVIYDEEPRYDIYKENLLRFTTADQLDIMFGMTPTNGITWIHDDIYSKAQDSTGNKIDWFQIPSVANRNANLKVLKEVIDEIPTYDERKMRLLGEFISLSGLVYGKLFKSSIHVIEPFETACTCGGGNHPPECPYSQFVAFLGVDPHMVKDSTAALCVLDRDDNFYVDTCYKSGVGIEEFKEDLNRLIAGRRLKFSTFDPSSDSSITIYNGLNIFRLCTTGKNKVPKAFKADKYQGSIAAGVSTIKQRLVVNEKSEKPTFFIMNRPENKLLINSMRTLQRETFVNEEEKGKKDAIAEGVHDHHACVRYILQSRLKWTPLEESQPAEIMPDEEAMLV